MKNADQLVMGPPQVSLSAAQIGASGVLLIQYKLLRYGIDSAAMTTDAGIDLVVYAPKCSAAMTVQVKTCLKPKPAGGKGRLAVDWWLREENPAQLIGLANLAGDQAWLFRRAEFAERAQQRPEGRLHLYFYTDEAYKARSGCHQREFESFLVENRIAELFGAPKISN